MALISVDELFQSTRPRGARREREATVQKVIEFQSTRPRGARLAVGMDPRNYVIGFNPRARVGRDL